jgi:DNA polymerase-3 subunit gamma/tau
MAYQVLARKWRPKRFSEVVGQEPVTLTLQNAIRHDRLAHAFLFSGVRGVGKTTTARILAAALNCHQGLSPEPCGECDSCREIASSSCVDVLEIDAASNTGIDSIREIRESVRYGAARDRFKVFIIDEVHMLSKGAFNALLKTLEEPPSHVKFILATTEYHKIPDTIASRCQDFEFKRIPFSAISQHLQLICGEEGVQAPEVAVQAIASAAQGSMRDALSSLDRVVAFSGDKIRTRDVQTLLGALDDDLVISLVKGILEKDRTSLLRSLSSITQAGVEPHSFVSRLIQHMRDLMVYKVVGWDEELLNLPDRIRDDLSDQAEGFTRLDLIRLYQLLVRTDEEMKIHANPFLHLEMALLTLVELTALPDLEETISQLGSGRGDKLTDASYQGAIKESSKSTISIATPSDKEKKMEPRASIGAKESVLPESEVVKALMGHLRKTNMGLHASLERAQQMTYEKGRLTVVFGLDSGFHYRMIDGGMKEKIEMTCSRLISSNVTVQVDLIDSGDQVETSSPTEEPAVQDFLRAFPGKYVVEVEN